MVIPLALLEALFGIALSELEILLLPPLVTVAPTSALILISRFILVPATIYSMNSRMTMISLAPPVFSIRLFPVLKRQLVSIIISMLVVLVRVRELLNLSLQ